MSTTARTTTYVVTYSNERGDSSERTFTDRAEAVDLFRDLAVAVRPAPAPTVPDDDADLAVEGWYDDTTFQRGMSVHGYGSRDGNQSVSFHAMIPAEAPTVEAPTVEAPSADYVIIAPDVPVQIIQGATVDRAEAELISAARAYAVRSGRSFPEATVASPNEWVSGAVRFTGGPTVTLVKVAR